MAPHRASVGDAVARMARISVAETHSERVAYATTDLRTTISTARARQHSEWRSSLVSARWRVGRRCEFVCSQVPPVGWHDAKRDRPGFVFEADGDAGHREQVVDEPIVAMAPSRCAELANYTIPKPSPCLPCRCTGDTWLGRVLIDKQIELPLSEATGKHVLISRLTGCVQVFGRREGGLSPR